MGQINLNNFKVITDKLNTFFVDNKFMVASEIPTEGEFKVGDIIINNGPTNVDEPMWICIEAGNPGTWTVFNSGSGDEIVKLKNTVVVNEAVNEVEIGIDGFNKGDDLTVYRNSVYMIEGIDYEVQGNKIVSLKGAWNAEGGSDYKFTFEVLKAVAKVNPDAVVGMDNLTEDVKEAIEAAGNIDLSGYATKEELNNIDMSGKQDKTDNGLVTTDKTIVGAINELFQNANNGKELIASAIGEPLSSNDTFSAMSTDINGLLSTFKTNMMNNGVTVESNDKFKSLIDKIATMVEEGSGKGIQYASGTFDNFGGYIQMTTTTTKTFTHNCNFIPNYIFLSCDISGTGSVNGNIWNACISTDTNSSDKAIYRVNGVVTFNAWLSNITNTAFDLNYYVTDIGLTVNFSDIKWYAIGVGEEDTTLRDSLASILTEEGVSVTEEDDMASLISKVDEEFEDTRSTLAGLMTQGGYDITGEEDIDTLLGLLTASGIKLDEIKQIACGYSHTFILKTDGNLWSCGDNSYGQLGLGHNTACGTFTHVTTNINNDVKQVFCGDDYTFIIKTDGSVWACGYNYYGGLGLGDNTERTTFTKVTININNDVKQIACGQYHTFILKNDGSVWSCGYNYYGELGLGTSSYSGNTTFTQVTTNINNDVKQISCGENHTFILKNDGSIWACGYNNYGQLGLGTSGTSTEYYTFTQVTTNINNDVEQIACRGHHTIILKTDGNLWSCGNNDYGELGIGENNTTENTFTQVTTNINNDIKQIACGTQHTFVLKNDGSIWACGFNGTGELGLGEDSNAYLEFTQVTTNINNDVKQIACGDSHTIILKTDGRIWSCGYNANCELGLGDATEREIYFTQIPKGL